jgi:hypothetical protein
MNLFRILLLLFGTTNIAYSNDLEIVKRRVQSSINYGSANQNNYQGSGIESKHSFKVSKNSMKYGSQRHGSNTFHKYSQKRSSYTSSYKYNSGHIKYTSDYVLSDIIYGSNRNSQNIKHSGTKHSGTKHSTKQTYSSPSPAPTNRNYNPRLPTFQPTMTATVPELPYGLDDIMNHSDV